SRRLPSLTAERPRRGTAALRLWRSQPASGRFGSALVRDQSRHGIERREVDVRVDLDLLVQRRVALTDARDHADRNTSREQGWVLLRLLPGRDDDVAAL